MNRFILALGAMLVLFAACNKPDSPTSAEEDLRAGTWRRTAGTVVYKDPQTRGDSTRNWLLTDDTCIDDNSLIYKENFIGIINHGALLCTPAESDKQFTWQITKDEKHLSMYGVSDYFPTDNVEADIITRTLGYLTIRYKVVSVNTTFHTSDTLTYTDVLRR